MQIRTFVEKDLNAVVQLWQDCGLTRPWNDPHKDIKRKMAVDPELFLVGEEEEQLIATVMGGYDGHRGWIYYLAVSPGIQRAGHGRQLMHEIEQRLIQRGCPKINLQIRTDNTAVIEFYSSLGFSEDNAMSMGKRLIPD